MVRIYYWLKIVWLSLKWIPRINLGDKVWYAGDQWTLTQGVCAPTWTLRAYGQKREVKERYFRKVRSLRNYVKSFQSGYRFYMGYWYDIWCWEGIKPWMRKCKIW
jgi:hypothetical protein